MLSETDHKKSALTGVINDDLAPFRLGMNFIFEADREWVKEHALRLVKRDAMFFLAARGFVQGLSEVYDIL